MYTTEAYCQPAVFNINRFQYILQVLPLRSILCLHFTNCQRGDKRVFIPHLRTEKVTAALLKPQDEPVGLPLCFQQTDLLADIFEPVSTLMTPAPYSAAIFSARFVVTMVLMTRRREVFSPLPFRSSKRYCRSKSPTSLPVKGTYESPQRTAIPTLSASGSVAISKSQPFSSAVFMPSASASRFSGFG